MPEVCALSMDNVTVVAKDALGALICRLRPARMTQVCEALRTATDC